MSGSLTHPDEAAIAWRRFVASPATYVTPERLAAAFDQAVTPEACRRLLALPRLEARLSDLLCSQNRLSATLGQDAVPDSDRAILLLAPVALRSLLRLAGAIHFAGSLSRIVLASEVRALDKALGSGVLARALARRDLAGPAEGLTVSTELIEQIDRAGWSCLLAWAASLPAEIGARLRLQMPDEMLPLATVTPEIGRPIIEAAHRAGSA
ncbi:SctK family type III secretion system sorting platform protein [Bosea sp. NPDC055332]